MTLAIAILALPFIVIYGSRQYKKWCDWRAACRSVADQMTCDALWEMPTYQKEKA